VRRNGNAQLLFLRMEQALDGSGVGAEPQPARKAESVCI
jgi:hypothetical protein